MTNGVGVISAGVLIVFGREGVDHAEYYSEGPYYYLKTA